MRRLTRLLGARRSPDAPPHRDGDGAGRAFKERRSAEREAREAFLAEARSLMPYVSVQVGDDVFFVPTADEGIAARVFVRRRSKDMMILARALGHLADRGIRMPDEPVFVEVGANIGTATVTALRHHSFAAGVAIEPSPGTFAALRLNLVANGLETRVHAIHAAASDQEGTRAFDVSHVNTGSHHLPETELESPEGTVTVQTVTLDGLVARGVIDVDRVGLVWIDAAGHEAHALAGASTLLEAGVPLVTAVKHGWPETEQGLVRLLTPAYTEVVELRYRQTCHPTADFSRLVESLQRSTDVLLVRR